MPDRDDLKPGDIVCAVFWEGCFTDFVERVDEDEEGFFIPTEKGCVGYLKGAYAVVKLMDANVFNVRMKEALGVKVRR